MQLDPTRWLVSLAGFAYDWIITREWARVGLCLLPLMVVGGMGVAAASAMWRSPTQLAQWYMELGDQEIAEWEESWAPVAQSQQPTDAAGATPEGADQSATSSVSTNSAEKSDSEPASADAASEEPQKVSRFAETLFRRAQVLSPSERSQYVIAATLAQRGALDQARGLLAKVAPDKGTGYAPAHALLARLLFMDLPRKDNGTAEEKLKTLMHHVNLAKEWDRCPRPVLLAGSEVEIRSGNPAGGIRLLEMSALRYPEDNYALARMALLVQDQRLFERTWPKAEQYLRTELDRDPKAVDTRLRLSEVYAMAGKFEPARQLLLEAPVSDRTADIKRALSEVCLIEYRSTQKVGESSFSANLKLLNAALSVDPTNPNVAEEIARLARLQGPRPTDEMIEVLKTHLAQGTATVATHALLGEMRLLRGELDLAIPHLEQVVNRLPQAAESLNNLAYCLAEKHSDRLQEALGYAQRAVAESKLQPNADYFDTLAHVLTKLGRPKEAITAVETAIEIDQRRTDFHERAAAVYNQLGDASMAQTHLQVVERLKREEAERLEAERLAAERRAAEERLEQQRLEAERLRAERLEELRLASEMAMAEIAAEVAKEAELRKAEQAKGATRPAPEVSPSAASPAGENAVN